MWPVFSPGCNVIFVDSESHERERRTDYPNVLWWNSLPTVHYCKMYEFLLWALVIKTEAWHFLFLLIKKSHLYIFLKFSFYFFLALNIPPLHLRSSLNTFSKAHMFDGSYKRCLREIPMNFNNIWYSTFSVECNTGFLYSTFSLWSELDVFITFCIFAYEIPLCFRLRVGIPPSPTPPPPTHLNLPFDVPSPYIFFQMLSILKL